MGFEYEPELVPHIVSIMLVFVCLAVTPAHLGKPSDFMKVFFFVVPVLPMLVLMAVANSFMLAGIVASAIYLFLSTKLTGARLRIPSIRYGVYIASAFSAAVVVVVVLLKIWFGGLAYATFDLTEVYELRDFIAEKDIPEWFVYLIGWAVTVLNIFLLSVALLTSRKIAVLAVIVLQLFLFSVTGHKTVLIYPLLVIALKYYASHGARGFHILLGFCALVIASLAVWWLAGENLVASIFVRRLLFVPAQVNYMYIEVFSNLEHVLLSNSIFGYFLEYPYAIPAPVIVSMQKYGNPDTWVNSGFIGAGFMQFGWWGVFVYALIIKFLLWLTDELSQGLPLWFSTSIVAPPFLILFTSSDLPTTLVTHGLIISLLLLWLSNEKAYRRPKMIRDFADPSESRYE